MELPRSWTLRHSTHVSDDTLGLQLDTREGTSCPDVEPGGEVRVIELDPILDLLEFWIGRPNGRYSMSEDAERDSEAILREHGRLQ